MWTDNIPLFHQLAVKTAISMMFIIYKWIIDVQMYKLLKKKVWINC